MIFLRSSIESSYELTVVEDGRVLPIFRDRPTSDYF